MSTARLEPLKRVDLIVEAFKQMPNEKLVVTSGGSQLDNLKKLAGDTPNIEFTGWVTEERLAELDRSLQGDDLHSDRRGLRDESSRVAGFRKTRNICT